MLIAQNSLFVLTLARAYTIAFIQAPPGAIPVTPGQGNIAKAIASLKGKTGTQTLFLTAGEYYENAVVDYGGPLIIQGYTTDPGNFSSNQVKIISKVNARQAGSNQKSAALWIRTNNFLLKNVVLINTYGPGSQAVALAAEGEKQVFMSCSFIGNQDTLLVALGTQYFKGCNIVGNTDFIFGSAAVWFEECTIGVKRSPNGWSSIIAANRRSGEEDPSIFVFNKCQVKAEDKVARGSTYLGRSWQHNGKISFQGCYLPGIISPEGWTLFTPNSVYENSKFYEIGNTGPGADLRHRKLLKASRSFSLEEVFRSDPRSWTFWPSSGGNTEKKSSN